MRQIEIFMEMGIGGFHVHCRSGLETEYLGEEYMDLVSLLLLLEEGKSSVSKEVSEYSKKI